MGKSSAPSIKTAAKEADVLKKKIDQLQKECVATLDNVSLPRRDEKLKTLYQECVEARKGLEDLTKRVTAMTKADEPTKITNFDGRKTEELGRLKKLMELARDIENKLEPDETEEEYFRKPNLRKIKDDLQTEDNGESGDEDDEEDDDDELEEEDSGEEEEESTYEDEEEEAEEEEETEDEDGASPTPLPDDMRVDYEVLHDFDKQEEGDLTVKTGEIITLMSIRDDGWWECENADGDRGYVPSTYLKEYVKHKDLMHDDTVEEEAVSPRSGKHLWGSIKKAMNETSVTDVLNALGAVPSGFREVTSGRLVTDDKYTHNNYSHIKLSDSNLFYRDLYFNPTTQKVRPRTARIQKILTLLEAKNIPPPGAKAMVINRLARVSLFDGQKIISNITTVQAQCVDREGKHWRFVVKPNTIESAECFVRIAEPSNSVGILIELSVIFTREGNDTPKELSCGWVFRPMFEENGTLIKNIQYDMSVNGGTPFEKGVEVDPTMARRTSSKFMTLISRNKQPILSLKTAAANNDQKEKLDVLPNVLVGKSHYLHAAALYRHNLACLLIRDKDDLLSTDDVFDPFAKHFPAVLEQPDLVDVLMDSWEHKLKPRNRTDKKDIDILMSTLIESFMEWIYPLLFAHLPPYKAGDPQRLQARNTVINTFLGKAHESNNSPLAGFLTSDIEYEPFDMSEVSYNVLHKHCITAY